MYRVRLGPYADRAEAQRVADRVRHDFKLDTWITASP
jgi:cell division protein FtsN